MSDKLPVGFGFAGYRFQIDVIKRTGFGGECMTCGAKVFAVQSRRHVTTYPKLKGKRDATHNLKREFLNGANPRVV